MPEEGSGGAQFYVVWVYANGEDIYFHGVQFEVRTSFNDQTGKSVVFLGAVRRCKVKV
jgi:hypothetical protein